MPLRHIAWMTKPITRQIEYVYGRIITEVMTIVLVFHIRGGHLEYCNFPKGARVV